MSASAPGTTIAESPVLKVGVAYDFGMQTFDTNTCTPEFEILSWSGATM
jgi:hypothetical protein